MDGLFVKLIIILFAVGVCIFSLFNADGLQKDASDMRQTTQTMVQKANTDMTDFTTNGSK